MNKEKLIELLVAMIVDDAPLNGGDEMISKTYGPVAEGLIAMATRCKEVDPAQHISIMAIAMVVDQLETIHATQEKILDRLKSMEAI